MAKKEEGSKSPVSKWGFSENLNVLPSREEPAVAPQPCGHLFGGGHCERPKGHDGVHCYAVRKQPAAPAPAAPLLSASDIAKKLVNAGDIDRREKILKQWVDSYIARWAAELEQVKAERDRMRDALMRLRDNNDAEYCECDHSDDNCCNKAGEHCTWCICEAALGEKGKQ